MAAENKRINALKAEFERVCSEIHDELQLTSCQAQVDAINRAVDAYNLRVHPFLARDERYSSQVRA